MYESPRGVSGCTQSGRNSLNGDGRRQALWPSSHRPRHASFAIPEHTVSLGVSEAGVDRAACANGRMSFDVREDEQYAEVKVIRAALRNVRLSPHVEDEEHNAPTSSQDRGKCPRQSLDAFSVSPLSSSFMQRAPQWPPFVDKQLAGTPGSSGQHSGVAGADSMRAASAALLEASRSLEANDGTLLSDRMYDSVSLAGPVPWRSSIDGLPGSAASKVVPPWDDHYAVETMALQGPETSERGQVSVEEAQGSCMPTSCRVFLASAVGKRIVVFLDYDGTLTPIVANPDEAHLSSSMRTIVHEVAQTFPTAIISGRGRAKVEAFVQLRDLFYAGSHGLDIKGPSAWGPRGEAQVLPLELDSGLLTTMAAVRKEVCSEVQPIAGATVEDNVYSVSVHFRNCAVEDYGQVTAAVTSVADRHKDAVRVTRGRKVLELRPKVDWDKGKALLHLLSALGLAGCSDVLPIYIGDDRTDEDAFAVLAGGRGVGILVSSIAKPTAAAYTLPGPTQVEQFLQELVAWGRCSSGNGWHAQPHCVGWVVNRGAMPLDAPFASPADAPAASDSSAQTSEMGAAHADMAVASAATGSGGVCTLRARVAAGSPPVDIAVGRLGLGLDAAPRAWHSPGDLTWDSEDAQGRETCSHCGMPEGHGPSKSAPAVTKCEIFPSFGHPQATSTRSSGVSPLEESCTHFLCADGPTCPSRR